MINLTLLQGCDRFICMSIDLASILIGIGLGMIFLYYFIIRKRYKYVGDALQKGDEQ